MTDLGALQAAIQAALDGAPALMVLFPGQVVRSYDVAPVNKPPPYIVIGEDDLLPVPAEGFDLAEVSATVHVWSLTDPPSLTEAKAIGSAVIDVLVFPFASPGVRIYAAELERVRYLIDPSDQITTHGVVTIRFTTAPAPPAP